MGGMHKCMPPCEWGLYICLCVLVGVERRERGYLCNCMYQLMFCEKTCERRRHIPTHISHPYHTQHIHITHHTSHPTHTHHTSHITPNTTQHIQHTIHTQQPHPHNYTHLHKHSQHTIPNKQKFQANRSFILPSFIHFHVSDHCVVAAPHSRCGQPPFI